MWSIQGRVSRSRYWLLAWLPQVILFSPFIILFSMFKAGISPNLAIWYGSFYFLLALPILLLAIMVLSVITIVKRYHDIDKSGWWILVSFVPVIGFIWSFIECGFIKGTDGPNRFGADPLQDSIPMNTTQPA